MSHYAKLCVICYSYHPQSCHLVTVFASNDTPFLLLSTCLTLYGSALWKLSCSVIHSNEVSFNSILRCSWYLPRNCHTRILHLTACSSSLFNVIISQAASVLSSALSCPSLTVRKVFGDSSLLAYTHTWYDAMCGGLNAKRNLYFKKAHHSEDRSDCQKFKQLRNEVVAKLRKAKCEYLSRLNSHEPKEFWKVVKSLDPKESTLPMLKCGDVIASSDQHKANILNNTFTNSFNHSIPGIGHGDLPDVALVDCSTEFLCTKDEVYELLSNLGITKANGPDDISARMLKETALSITPIVTHLFNISITPWKVT